MAELPQSFMIFKEELRKEKFEKEKLKKEYQIKLKSLTDELNLLKEKLSAQESMMEVMSNYVVNIESSLNALNTKVNNDENRSYH